MTPSSNTIAVYLEVGSKRTIAGAIDWPGWCRVGRDEDAALQALVENAPRYAQVLRHTQLSFQPLAAASALTVVERLEGNTTTDFGAPDVAPSSDADPLNDVELQRLQTLLAACWQAFDDAIGAATGKVLRVGPRGGGRDLDGIVRHVLGAQHGYLARLGRKRPKEEAQDLRVELDSIQQAVAQTLAAAARGESPARGPRGGAMWSPRFFVRRAAWHVLDHVWEIEDRVM